MVFVFHFLASFQRGEGRRIMGERRERVKSKNMYKGPMDKDKVGGRLEGGGRIECGGRWAGQGRVKGENWTQL